MWKCVSQYFCTSINAAIRFYVLGINPKVIIRVKVLVSLSLKSYRGLQHIWLGQAWCQLTPTGQTIRLDKQVECLLSASVVELLSPVPVWIFELLCTEVSLLSSHTQRHLNPNETKWQLITNLNESKSYLNWGYYLAFFLKNCYLLWWGGL